MVGLVSMGIAALLGIILGALAGFFGDNKLKMPRIKYHFTLFGVFMGLFYGFGQRKYVLSQAFSEGIAEGMIAMLISIGVVIGITMLFRILSKAIKVEWLNKEVSVPMDTFVSRGIELLNSIPRIIINYYHYCCCRKKYLDCHDYHWSYRMDRYCSFY